METWLEDFHSFPHFWWEAPGPSWVWFFPVQSPLVLPTLGNKSSVFSCDCWGVVRAVSLGDGLWVTNCSVNSLSTKPLLFPPWCQKYLVLDSWASEEFQTFLTAASGLSSSHPLSWFPFIDLFSNFKITPFSSPLQHLKNSFSAILKEFQEGAAIHACVWSAFSNQKPWLFFHYI